MKHALSRAFAVFLCLVMLAVSCSGAIADSLTLPEGVATVEEDAFAGCVAVKEITLPAGTETIEQGAFTDTGETLWIHCSPGKVSRQLLEAGFDVEAGTVYRALIIGQTYAGNSAVQTLEGTMNDAQAVRFCLAALDRTEYTSTVKSDRSAEEILSLIGSTFNGATENDVSIFYYSGHGEAGGALVGRNGELLTPTALRGALDSIKGRKVIIVDACYSGAITTAGLKQGAAAGSFNSAFLSAFSGGKLNRTGPEAGSSGDGGYSQYYIMTSAREDQTCMEDWITSGSSRKIMGYFSYFLCRGCGWDGVTSRSVNKAADANNDGVVSFGEAFSYAAAEARKKNRYQDAQSNMTGCKSFSPFR